MLSSNLLRNWLLGWSNVCTWPLRFKLSRPTGVRFLFLFTVLVSPGKCTASTVRDPHDRGLVSLLVLFLVRTRALLILLGHHRLSLQKPES